MNHQYRKSILCMIHLFNRLLFWTEKAAPAIKCSMTDGTGTATVATGLNRVKGIAVDMTGKSYHLHGAIIKTQKM